MSNQNTPNRLSTPSGFSFGKLLTPKLRQMINFDSQPVQAGSPEVKKSGLEAYAKKNKLSLPADFSDLVLECEMELEKEEVSLDTITRLTDLYSQAMAYYEAEGSHKYKYFAKKLQDLMLKPNVKETMVREIAPAKTGEQDKELKRMRLESQISKVNTEKEAFTLVKTHEHKEKEIKRVLQGDLTSQRDRIQKKLAQRKAKSQSRAQSVTYISDDASSTTEEVQGDGDKDASPKAENKLIKIEEADEADESRYGTPPRRRNKDGQMIIYFPKGNKSLKRLFLDELKKENEEVKKARGHVRRNSENKAPVLGGVTPGANKRTARAQSFTARNLVYPGLDRLRHTTSFEKEEHKEQQEVKSAVDIVLQKEEHVESATVVEKNEEEKPKSNNIVEEADEEGSKNGSASNSKSNVEQEEVAVAEKADEVNQEGPAQEVVEEKHVATGGSVVINDEAHVEEKEEVVVGTPVHASEEKEPEAPVQAEEEEIRQEVAQEEKEAEPVVEEQEVKEEQVEAEVVKENNEEEIKQEAVEEEKEPEVPVQVEEEVRQEVAQEEKEAEQEVAVEQQENKEEAVAEAEAEIEVVQENNEVQAEVVNEVQQEVNKEEEQREPENVVAAVEETIIEKVEEENNAPEVQQVEVAEVEQKEEIKTETENINQEQVAPEVQEEKEEKLEETAPVVANKRTRTDSEIADEEKLKMMRKIDEEHKLLLEELVNKQTVAKEEATKQVEEKFQKKLQAMEEDMDEDEKLSMMWQKAIAKINKDKETELQKVLEALAQEQAQEVEKYKKKLQQQKMFKLAELDS